MRDRSFPFGPYAAGPDAFGAFGVIQVSRQRRAAARASGLAATRAPTHDLRVEALSGHAAAAFVTQWRDLIGRSLEANVFCEPAVALAAAQHLRDGRRSHFLFVWDESAGAGDRRLIAVCPVQLSGQGGSSAVARVWTHKQAALATPLLDRDQAGEALDAIFAYCRRTSSTTAVLMFPMLPLAGPTALLLQRRAAAEGTELCILDPQDRAVLNHGADPEQFLDDSVTPKRLKKLRRARERLARHGEVTVRVARDPADVRAAAEEFLALEAKGWKGRRGTALLSSPQLSAFMRTLTRTLAGVGTCSIHSLDVGGTPVAMAVLLTCGERAYIWKVAYDEAYAAFSPGVQLTLDITRAQLADGRIAVTDSCAVANHPMIDHLWPERMSVGDVCVCVAPQRSAAFAVAIRRVKLWRSVRSRLKDTVRGLRRWRLARA